MKVKSEKVVKKVSDIESLIEDLSVRKYWFLTEQIYGFFQQTVGPVMMFNPEPGVEPGVEPGAKPGAEPSSVSFSTRIKRCH